MQSVFQKRTIGYDTLHVSSVPYLGGILEVTPKFVRGVSAK